MSDSDSSSDIQDSKTMYFYATAIVTEKSSNHMDYTKETYNRDLTFELEYYPSKQTVKNMFLKMVMLFKLISWVLII